MKPIGYAALAVALLMSTGWAKPKTIRPVVDDAAMLEEAHRQLLYVYESRLADQWRVQAIADRLLLANADLCPVTKRYAGFSTAVVGDVPVKYQPMAAKLFGPGAGPVLTYVSAGGPAAEAGLAKGDEVVKLGGVAVKTGKGGADSFNKTLAKALEGSEPIALTYRRGGEEHDALLQPSRRCGYNPVINDDAEVNAYADGVNIVLSRPILRVAATDEELALVIAHELAHNAEGHIKAQKKNVGLGMLGGAAVDLLIVATTGVDMQGTFMNAGAKIGAEVYSVAFEEEADYVGMYFLTRAGFKTEGVEQFWRRMAVENPGAIMAKSSHPPSAQRYLAIRATREEIGSRGDQAAGLVPQRLPEEAPKAVAAKR